MSTNTRIWAQTEADEAQTEAYERISGLCLQPRILALTGMRVVTQDFGRKSKLNFGHNPSCSYVKPVVTRGSTVAYSFLIYFSYSSFDFDVWNEN